MMMSAHAGGSKHGDFFLQIVQDGVYTPVVFAGEHQPTSKGAQFNTLCDKGMHNTGMSHGKRGRKVNK